MHRITVIAPKPTSLPAAEAIVTELAGSAAGTMLGNSEVAVSATSPRQITAAAMKLGRSPASPLRPKASSARKAITTSAAHTPGTARGKSPAIVEGTCTK